MRADIYRAYDERRPPEPTFPGTRPSIADFAVEADEEPPEVENLNENGSKNGVDGQHDTKIEDVEIRHAPPGCGSPSFSLGIR